MKAESGGSPRRNCSASAGSLIEKRLRADRGVIRTMSKLRPDSSPARLRSAGAGGRSLSEQSEGGLLADLPGRLPGLLNSEREASTAEAAAARLSAAEIRRFAIR